MSSNRPSPYRVALSALATSVVLAGCDQPPHSDGDRTRHERNITSRPSIVLVTVDSLGTGAAIPNLGRLAERGARFSDVASTAPLTRPALASIFFSEGPDRLEVRDNLIDSLPAGRSSLAEALRAAGYRTAGFSGTPFASLGAGFDRGFEIFDGPVFDFYGVQQSAEPGVPSATLVPKFVSWLDGAAREGRPLFVWMHLADLSNVATNGEPAEARAAWDKSLGDLDAGIAAVGDKVLSTLGDRVELLIVGTHGALLEDAGRRGDSYWLEDGTLQVPLVWVGPRARDTFGSGALVEAPAWIPDIGATVLDLAGLPAPSGDGRSLLRGADGGGARERLAWTWATDDHFAWPPRTAKRDGTAWVGIGPGAHSRAAVSRPRALSAEVARALAKAGVAVGESRGATSPPAKDEMAAVQLAWDVRHAFFKPPKPLLALKRSLRLVQAEPENFGALLHRQFVLYASGNPKSAQEMSTRLLARYPDRHEALHWSAHVAQEAKRNPAGQALLEAAVSIGPQEAELYYDLACARAVAGDRDVAFDWLAKAIERGYRQWSHIENDPDLANLRSDRRYAELMGKHGR